ncbi:hypothetical protein JCM33374_g967 [Metschnikowia sp. JCM 33374]|nr:hypothetical protein JCM33374_g967 [Metschnikowia sp. JCM 33374]
MTTVSSITPLLPYTRRVSFNNLQHEDHEAGAPPDVTRLHSYTMSPKEAVPKSADPELSKLFSTYSLSSSATSTPRKRLRLPDPPSKSILKNKLSTEQLRSNVAHAIEFGASFNKELNDLVNHPPESVPRSELAKVLGGDPSRSYSEVFAADSDDESSPLASPLTSPLTSPHGPPHAPPHAPPPERRRKSYSSMTNEELMALDPQFSKPNSSNLKDFKFDAVGPVYGAQRKNSAPGMMVSPPVKAKQVLYPSSNENNYQSVTLTVKHKDFEHKHAYPRTLLTVISGRKHTWNTLDWLLLTDESLKETPGFLQNGDHLVVAALVPLKFLQAENKSNSRKKDTPEKKVQQKCENILEYVLDNLPDPKHSPQDNRGVGD